MSHVDPEILALLAVGDPAGTEQDAEHIALCRQCSAELDELTDVAVTAVGIGLDPEFRLESPPSGVWEQVSAHVAADIALAPARTTSRMPRRWPAMLRRPVALAVAGLIVGAGSATAIEQFVLRPQTRTVSAAPLRPLPQFPQWRSATGTAELEAGSSGRSLRVRLHAQSAAGYFEVWLLGRDGVSMISLGDLSAAGTGRFALPPGTDLRFYSRVDISLQPFNGSTAHSSVSVVRGPVPGY